MIEGDEYDALDDDALMDRVRGAVAFVNARGGEPGVEMAGFLALFHPEMPEERKRALIADAQRKERA